MVIYGLYNLIQANYFLFALILLSASGLIVGWLLLQHLRNGRIIYRINTFLFSVLILYMLLFGGEGGSKILWMYTFPLISFFLLGKTEGLFWSATVLLISIILFWNPFNLSIAYDYPKQLKIRFLTTYLIVSAITYWFEYFRYHYRIDIELKNQLLQQEITERKQAEKEREKLIAELQEALTNVKTLSSLLPICMSCKKIRDDKGYWNQIEEYITEHTDTLFSHGMCPDCFKKLYPDYFKDDTDKDI
jgi:PAS domain-containing protein